MIAVASGVAAPATARTGDVYTIYLAPDGSDGNDGRTQARAIKSLARAQQVLLAARPAADVEIRIKYGVYEAPPLGSWTFYVPGHTVTFLPLDYEYGEGAGGIAGRPIFRNKATSSGTYPNGAWMTARLGGALPDGGTSGLRFYYLQVERYSDGLGMMGLTWGKDTDGGDPPFFKRTSKGLNGNLLAGMVFRKIGTKWTGDNASHGYGAVVLTNSSNNKLTNNYYSNVENAGSRAGIIHGVYVTHFSSQNMIEKSRFRYISGAPAKVRDRSTLNSFETSVFERTGVGEYYMDDVCDYECFKRFNARAEECAGYHNRFINNRLLSGYGGGRPERVWRMFPWKRTDAEALRYAGDPGRCSLPNGETRLRTWGNKTS